MIVALGREVSLLQLTIKGTYTCGIRVAVYRCGSTTLSVIGFFKWLGKDALNEEAIWSISMKAGDPRGSTGSGTISVLGTVLNEATDASPAKCLARNRILKFLTREIRILPLM